MLQNAQHNSCYSCDPFYARAPVNGRITRVEMFGSSACKFCIENECQQLYIDLSDRDGAHLLDVVMKAAEHNWIVTVDQGWCGPIHNVVVDIKTPNDC